MELDVIEQVFTENKPRVFLTRAIIMEQPFLLISRPIIQLNLSISLSKEIEKFFYLSFQLIIIFMKIISLLVRI